MGLGCAMCLRVWVYHTCVGMDGLRCGVCDMLQNGGHKVVNPRQQVSLFMLLPNLIAFMVMFILIVEVMLVKVQRLLLFSYVQYEIMSHGHSRQS